MNKLMLNDLLNFTDQEINNTKVKLNIFNGVDNPMDLYLEDPDKVNNDWLLWKNDRSNYYMGQYAMCFINLRGDFWLLTTIKKIVGELGLTNDVNYIGEEIEEYSKYYGRVVIKYHNTNRNPIRYYSGIYNDFEVQQILPSKYDGDKFPGYDKVMLSYSQLKNILEKGKSDWINALENQKAVYLITDIKSGKLYVGSATSQSGMLLSRWESYINNGHGGNKGLRELISKEGIEYARKYYQFSILENYNSKTDDSYILSRESWWKEALKSREFGYNCN